MREGPNIPPPELFLVEDTPSRRSISWRWLRAGGAVDGFPGSLSLIGFAGTFFLVVGLVFLASAAFLSVDAGPVTSVGHAALGVGLLYAGLALLINRTTVRVRSVALTTPGGPFRGGESRAPSALEVRHGPLWWPGNRDLARDEIERLYCEERLRRGRRDLHPDYLIYARSKGAQVLRLIQGLYQPEQARYLVQELERWLELRHGKR
jgi:hypothetical protein